MATDQPQSLEGRATRWALQQTDAEIIMWEFLQTVTDAAEMKGRAFCTTSRKEKQSLDQLKQQNAEKNPYSAPEGLSWTQLGFV